MLLVGRARCGFEALADLGLAAVVGFLRLPQIIGAAPLVGGQALLVGVLRLLQAVDAALLAGIAPRAVVLVGLAQRAVMLAFEFGVLALADGVVMLQHALPRRFGVGNGAAHAHADGRGALPRDRGEQHFDQDAGKGGRDAGNQQREFPFGHESGRKDCRRPHHN